MREHQPEPRSSEPQRQRKCQVVYQTLLKPRETQTPTGDAQSGPTEDGTLVVRVELVQGGVIPRYDTQFAKMFKVCMLAFRYTHANATDFLCKCMRLTTPQPDCGYRGWSRFHIL